MRYAVDMGEAVWMAAEPVEPYGCDPRHVPPTIDRPPYTPRELYALFKGGEVEADRCEALLAHAARGRGAIDLAIAEGLDALLHGDRLAQLCLHLDDYAREVLGIEGGTARKLATFARGLRDRPLLRDAVRAGRVRIRAAQTVLSVAVGEAERFWVERAANQTVRALEAAVREAGKAPEEDDEPRLRLRALATPEQLEVIDEALVVAARVLPGSDRAAQLEAIAQEWLGVYPGDPAQDGVRKLNTAFQPLGARPEETKAALETETHRWSMLPPVPGISAPEVTF